MTRAKKTARRPSHLLGFLIGLGVGGGLGIAAAARRRAWDEPYVIYRVQPGDTLSALALRFFGDAERWPVLHQSMPTLPDDAQKGLPVGAQIRVPCQWIVVGKGDSLAAVAKRTLGAPGRWQRIYEANKAAIGPDPNKLAVGQHLAVPVADLAVPVAGGAGPGQVEA